MFPMTITLHDSAQLNAVLIALQSTLKLRAEDFAHPAVAAAYEEAAERVAAHAEPTTADLVRIAQERAAANRPGTYTEADQAADKAAAQVEEAAAQQGKSKGRTRKADAPSPDAPTSPPAPSSPTAEAVAAAAPASTASAPIPAAAPAAAQPRASTAAAEPISYEQVSRAITRMATTRRAHVVAVLAEFGVTSGQQLRDKAPERFAEFLEALHAGEEVSA